MQHVFVVDATRRPLMPCRPARARRLLSQHRAAVLRRFPFTIILSSARTEAIVEPLRLKIDPGSRTTGLALVREQVPAGVCDVVWAAEVSHRGEQIHQALMDRRAVRRSRRQRHTRYRRARFANRTRPAGWLPPALQSRVQNTVTWVQRLRRWCPVGEVTLEAVRFDTQLLQDADIAGIRYQQGTLAGTEVREYLLLKWGYRCAYCHQEATQTNHWEIDHIDPRSRGGSDRVSNLALSCHACNQAKGDRTAAEFGHPEVQAQAKAPLRDAAAVNSTRRSLHQRLLGLGLPVETASGGVTKWNRTRRGLPKTHWLDALCAGTSTPERIRAWRDVLPLVIQAQRWQRRQMCLVDRYGFPRTHAKGASRAYGFKTGDVVRAIVPTGKPRGTHEGKVAIKARGQFTITTRRRTVPDVPHRCCKRIHRADGYTYQKGACALLPIP